MHSAGDQGVECRHPVRVVRHGQIDRDAPLGGRDQRLHDGGAVQLFVLGVERGSGTGGADELYQGPLRARRPDQLRAPGYDAAARRPVVVPEVGVERRRHAGHRGGPVGDDDPAPDHGVVGGVEVAAHDGDGASVADDALLVPEHARPGPPHLDAVRLEVVVGRLVRRLVAGRRVEQHPHFDAAPRVCDQGGRSRGIDQRVHRHVERLPGGRDEPVDRLIAGLGLSREPVRRSGRGPAEQTHGACRKARGAVPGDRAPHLVSRATAPPHDPVVAASGDGADGLPADVLPDPAATRGGDRPRASLPQDPHLERLELVDLEVSHARAGGVADDGAPQRTDEIAAPVPDPGAGAGRRRCRQGQHEQQRYGDEQDRQATTHGDSLLGRARVLLHLLSAPLPRDLTTSRRGAGSP